MDKALIGFGFFAAIAMVARFQWHCRTHGWSPRPAYAPHIDSACRGAGMTFEATFAFSRAWALDMGGTGPL